MAMSMKANNGGGDFDPCPAGNHPAVLIGLIDVGTQDESFQGVAKEARKIYLCWEIPGEKTSSGRSHVIGREYTCSFHEKAGLRKLIESWRGKPFADGESFDLTKLIGAACLLNVIHDGNGEKQYAKVSGVSAMPKGMAKPTATIKPITFDLDDNAPDEFPTADWLPWSYGEQLVVKVSRSPEWKAKGGTPANAAPKKQTQPAQKPAAKAPVEDEEPVPF